jgi:hypothetical protein
MTTARRNSFAGPLPPNRPSEIETLAVDVTVVIKEIGNVPINALKNIRLPSKKGVFREPWNVLSAVQKCLKSMIT